MNLTRRAFTQGATAIAGSVAGAPSSGLKGLAAVPSADDAYEALLSSYIATEEQALASGMRAGSKSGALTAHGRLVEAYLARLDLQIDPLTTARQLLTDFRSHMSQSPEAAQTPARRVTQNLADIVPEPDTSATDEHAASQTPEDDADSNRPVD